jgi:uncharacterized protein YbjT (DUF2867 family)
MILVTGATGFVGSHLVKRMRELNLPVRALVRRPEQAERLRELGAELAQGDISDKASLEKAAQGCEQFVHLVGIIQESARATFRNVHVEGTRNALDAAQKAGVRGFFFQSALGTRSGAKSEYHRTKWEAEELVRASGLAYTILRPSLMYGPGDQFTIRLSDMIRLSPVLPIIGSGKSKVQPLFIDDAVACMIKALTSDCCTNRTLEIGGPGQLTYEEVTRAIADAMSIKRPVVHMPLFFMKAAARMFETVLPKPPVTTDQLIMLQEDNVCSMTDIREALGVEPVEFRAGLNTFLR